jgi:hypothetical protein
MPYNYMQRAPAAGYMALPSGPIAKAWASCTRHKYLMGASRHYHGPRTRNKNSHVHVPGSVAGCATHALYLAASMSALLQQVIGYDHDQEDS